MDLPAMTITQDTVCICSIEVEASETGLLVRTNTAIVNYINGSGIVVHSMFFIPKDRRAPDEEEVMPCGRHWHYLFAPCPQRCSFSLMDIPLEDPVPDEPQPMDISDD